MRDYIVRHKIRIIIFILFFAGFIGGLAVLFAPNMEGRLLSYKKTEGVFLEYDSRDNFEFNATEYMDIPEKTINDMWEHRDKYSEYYIDYELINMTDHSTYDLQASLSGTYDDLWFDVASICEGRLDLRPHEILDNNRLRIIVKTENMTDDEIDGLIRNIRINISSTNFPDDSLFFNIIRNTTAIKFDK